MANTALLIVADTRDVPPEWEPASALLGANYSIPVLWLSMFTVADVVQWRSTLDPTWVYSALCARRYAGITRSEQRLAAWKRLDEHLDAGAEQEQG